MNDSDDAQLLFLVQVPLKMLILKESWSLRVVANVSVLSFLFGVTMLGCARLY